MLEPGMLRTAGKRDILLRMLLNLKRAYVRLRSFPQAHAVTELLVAMDPAALTELRDRGLLASQLREYASALHDLETWLRLAPAAGDADPDERQQVWDHVKDLRRRLASLN
jgi:regulator of sirC expression with transglutaminase-like and TPR domain